MLIAVEKNRLLARYVMTLIKPIIMPMSGK